MSEIRLVGFRKEFKELVAVKDVTVTFPTSTVTCLLGPSGCGKTTMMRMIAGLERPTAGEVFFDDERVTDLPTRKRNIGMVFQYPVVYHGISVYQNIELPLLEQKLSAGERKKRIEEVVEILRLQDSINNDVSQLGMGARQKVAVARVVARQPRIILFDEPITNVDVKTKVQIKRALKVLTKQRNQTIIYVTHDQTDAMTLADQIALMNTGQIVQCDAPRRLYNYPNDVFSGWFLGNPGMNFFEHQVESSDAFGQMISPLFPTPIRISAAKLERRITLGIRPEHVMIRLERVPMSVCGKVVHKIITLGGQYLLTGRLGESIIKVKVTPEIGQQVEEEAWVECPFEWITVFGSERHRREATLSAVGSSR
jgi:ABC-type sugar transport system ATPase subunit